MRNKQSPELCCSASLDLIPVAPPATVHLEVRNLVSGTWGWLSWGLLSWSVAPGVELGGGVGAAS